MAVAHEVVAGQEDDPASVGPVAGPAPELHRLLGEAVRDVLAGSDPVEALDAAAADAEDLLEAYRRGQPSG